MLSQDQLLNIIIQQYMRICITEKKGKLVMELLTSGGLIIDRKTVNDLIMEHIRKAV